MEILTGFALVFYVFFVLKNKEVIYKVPGMLPLLLFLLYILFQLMPLPSFVIKFLSPDAYTIQSTTQFITGKTSWMHLSVHPKATLTEFFRYGTYVMFYGLTVQLLSRKSILQTTVFIITLFGGLLALSSILQFYLTEDMALWFRHVPNNSLVFGPYVNHNHYAGLMELMFPIVLGLFLFYRPRIGNTSLIKGIAEIFSQEKANIHILIGTSALLIVISIFVSLSRGAMISTFISLILFTFLLLKRKISRGNTVLIIGVIMLTALCIGWFGWDQIFERFARLKNAQGVIYESRLDFWMDSKEIIRHYQLTGSGMGTFSHIYPLHRSLNSDRFLTHAHNDYLELLAEGGITGFLIAVSFLISLFYKTYTVFSKRRDAFSIYLYMGSVTALTAILLHSFTDFNLHIGANGLWFFFVAGVAVCAANTGMRKTSLATRLVPAAPGARGAAGVLIPVMTVLILIFNVSNLLGIFYYSNIKDTIISAETPQIQIQKIDKVAGFATKFDPLTAEYPFIQANTAWFLKDLSRARSFFIKSLSLDPLNSRHLNRFATFLARKNEAEKAATAFKKSMSYDQSNPEYTFQYAAWLFSRNDIEQGLLHMKHVLAMDETYFDRAVTAMIVAGIDSDGIERSIPDMAGPSIAFAGFLYDTGKVDEAIDRYLASLDLIEKMQFKSFQDQKTRDQIKRSLFYKVYGFFKTHNDIQNAMQTMERAETVLPLDARIKVTLGDLYYQQGILYKALDKYDYALLLDPGNKKARKMIEKINP